MPAVLLRICFIAKLRKWSKNQSGSPNIFHGSHLPTVQRLVRVSTTPPPHPIKPSRSHQDPIRWPTPCGGCKCFKMGSKQCNSIKAIEGQHETSPKIRSQGGAGPFHQRGKYGEFMLHQVFRGNSWGVKRVLVRPRPKWQSYLIIPPQKKRHRRCQKLDTSGSINTLRVPQSCFLSKPVLKTLLQTLAPVCRFCQPKNGQSKVGNFITMEKKHLTDKRYLGICNLQYSRI